MRCKCSWWVLAAIGVSLPALGQPSSVCSPQDAPRVISGGVGESELQALREVEPAHNLKLVFTLEGGQYVADVAVEISGATPGKIMRHRASGPVLLACLLPGIYTVTVEYEALRQSRQLTVGKGLHTEYFRWAPGPGDVVLKPEPRTR